MIITIMSVSTFKTDIILYLEALSQQDIVKSYTNVKMLSNLSENKKILHKEQDIVKYLKEGEGGRISIQTS